MQVKEATGVPQSTYQKYESGERRPSAAFLKNLHVAFGVRPDEILLDAPDAVQTLSSELDSEARSAWIRIGEALRDVRLRAERLLDWLDATMAGESSEGHTVRVHRVAAGKPIEAIEGDRTITVPSELVKSERTYAIQVVGTSMVDVGIEDGAVVLVEPRPDPPDGAIVVARRRSTNEVTLKKVYRRGKKLELRPMSKAHRSESWPADDADIQGIYLRKLPHPTDGSGGIRK